MLHYNEYSGEFTPWDKNKRKNKGNAKMETENIDSGKKIENEESASSKVFSRIFNVVAIAMSLYQMFAVVHPIFSPVEHANVHLAFALTLVFLMGLATSKSKKNRLIDSLLLVAALASTMYIMVFFDRLVDKIGLVTDMDVIIGVFLILVILEATRRTFGIALPILVVVFLLYTRYGEVFPGFFNHAGFEWPRLIASLTTNFTGVYGPILDISATFLALFMIFGGLLDASGAGQFFINLAMALGGRTRSGPAQAAVISSCLVGSINGSATANVVTTGVFTIPLMKSCGYAPKMAAAIEAVASTGGMIMPPVMGVGAFIMAGITGIPYNTIAFAALIPALLYYFTAAVAVHLHSIKHNFKPIEESKIPNLKKVLKEGGHFLLPLIAIVYYMSTGRSVMRAGLNGIIVLFLVVILYNTIRQPNYILTKNFWKFPKFGLISGAKGAMGVAAACAAMGVMSQAMIMSGLAFKIVFFIKSLSAGYGFIGLLLTMLICLFFGMGIPTTASYILVAVIGAASLIELGFSVLSVHLFIYYYAILANLTPPVCSAVLVASRMAGSNYLETGWVACRLGLTGFILPFLFIYNPELLLQGSIRDIAITTISAFFGMFAMAASFEGYLFKKLNIIERILLSIATLALIFPAHIAGLIGYAILGGMSAIQLYAKKRVSEDNRVINI
jgi:TRAP transporter 4TM/12TM fusion protein